MAVRQGRRAVFETLEKRLALAAFTPGNILVSNSPFGQQSMLYEYTPSGTQVQAIPIVQPVVATTEQARGVVVDSNGNAQIFNGSLNPRLTTYNPSLPNPFSSVSYPDWDTSVQPTYGAITAVGNYVFVADQQLAAETSADQGIVRFDVNNLSSAWTLAYAPDIGDATGNTSTTIPHMTVQGTGNGAVAYYSVVVTTANSEGIFAIDNGNTGSPVSFNSTLQLFDSQGDQLAEDLDGSSVANGAGENSSNNAFLEYTFAQPGTYVIEVGGSALGPIPTGSTYNLNLSIQNHALYVPGGTPLMNEVQPNDTFPTAQDTDTAIRFGSNDGNPIDVTAGLDGNLYVLEESGGSATGGNLINVYDPNTLQLEKSITLPQDYYSIAVDQLGIIYAGDTTIDSYNQSGSLLGSLPTPNTGGGQISSIALSPNGELVAGDTNGMVIVSNTNLVGSSSFETRASNGSNFVAIVQPPLTFPQATNESFSVLEGSQDNTFPVTINDLIDSRGQITVTAVGQANQGGTVSIVGNKSVRYTPAPLFYGTETFTYTIADGLGDSGTGTITVDVTKVDHNPTANPDSYAVLEGAATTTFNVLANDTALPDVGDTLSLVSVGPASQGGTVSIMNNEVQYTPSQYFFGTETFPYTMTNGTGQFATTTVTVTVTHVVHNPTANPDSFDVAPDADPTIFNVLANDTIAPDLTKNTLTITGVGPTNEGGTVSITPSGGSVIYQPANGFQGTETFTYAISDGLGGTATGTVTVDVAPIIPPPTLVDNTYNVHTNAVSVNLAVLTNAATLPPNQPLTITAVSTPDSGGQVTIASNSQTVNYAPALNFVGAEHFTYTAAEANGASSTGTVTVNVGNYIQNPVTTAAQFRVSQNSTNVTLNVLSGDSDPESSPLSIASVTAGNQGGTVTVSADGQSLIYTPKTSFLGTETFTYVVDNNYGGSATGSVTVTVHGWQNPNNPLDVANTGSAIPTPNDALILINELNAPAATRIQGANGLLPIAPANPTVFYDVNGDGYLTAADVLLVINAINNGVSSGVEAASVPASNAVAAVATSTSATGLTTGLSAVPPPATSNALEVAQNASTPSNLTPALLPVAPTSSILTNPPRGSVSTDLESILDMIAPAVSRRS